MRRVRVLTDVGTRSRTKQSFGPDTDVNAIMRKYLSTGLVDHMNRSEPRYGDFSDATDYLTAMSMVREAQLRFDSLPAKVRDHVDNDPAKLLDMVFDVNRVDEVRALGLIPPSEVTGVVVPPADLPVGETPP